MTLNIRAPKPQGRPGVAMAWLVLLFVALYAVATLSTWIAVAALVVFLVVVLATGARVRRRLPGTYWVLIASVVAGAAAMAYFRWTFVVSLAAADAVQPQPAGAQFGGVGLVLFLLCGAVAVVALVRLIGTRAV